MINGQKIEVSVKILPWNWSLEWSCVSINIYKRMPENDLGIYWLVSRAEHKK